MQFSKSQSFRGSISTAENEQQLFNDNNRSIFGDRLYFFNYEDELKDDLNLTLNSGEKKTLENDDYIETWQGNDEGLIWGKKEARDKSWKEEWIEQRNIPKDSNMSQVSYSEDELPKNNNFQSLRNELSEKGNEEEDFSVSKKFENWNRASLGQLIGVDYRKNRRWKEKWFRRGRRLFVRKFVQQLCENNSRVLNVWFEDSEFNLDPINIEQNKSNWKLVRNNKYGKKISDQKEWKESNDFYNDYNIILYEERGVSSGSNNYPYYYSKRKKVYKDNSEIIYSKYYKGNNEKNETFDIETITSRYNESDNLTLNELSLTNSVKDTKYSESWNECIEIDSYGNKKGRKYGSKDKTEWHEVWFEEIDGSKEYDIWYENGEMQWGEKMGYSKSNNESFKVKWEEKKKQGELRREKYIEKSWEKVGEQNSWGEKFSECVDQTSIGKKVQLLKENWYNNGTEVFKEKFNEDSQFNDRDEDELPILIFRSGEKRGERLATGETWSEDWNENLRKCEVNRKIIRTKLFTDKWWTKKSGEKWGEKKTIKLKQESSHDQELKILDKKDLDPILQNEHLYVENTESWYSSEFEEYSDTWETDGLNQHGYKKGIDRKQNNNRFIKWEEEWNKDHLKELKKKCTWELMDETGLIEVWTEDKFQDESGNFIVNKRGKKYNLDNRIEILEEWEETCNDDGNGNVYTKKQGKGRENWYLDEFGKSECTGEQWAVKQGFDNEGSWSERWSERSGYKEAWKKGENRYGDKWEEEWKEDFENKWKWARKSGENNIGDRWKEEWREEVDIASHISKKSASKKGKKMISGEEWSEEWGELYYGIGNEFMGDGGVYAEHMEKWANKYATDGSGNEWGNSWGDMWSWSTKVKSWGEKWENSHITEKW
ncbi:AT hook motif-containing [Cryptosporidium sp. chipmunk genotype I]|uniref:AT hook motif-containing n=1 Tax=Cryptosporidium sp. chipmunk genotype I TaxID=1280935 RepID=UPI00351A96B1|nr:AT hook motif-containing [Cryptosporidium sp. chipmunk genotype I]